jgi:hypothetical protein
MEVKCFFEFSVQRHQDLEAPIEAAGKKSGAARALKGSHNSQARTMYGIGNHQRL